MNSTRTRRAFFQRIGTGEELLRAFDLLPDVSFFLKDRQCRFIAVNRRGAEYCQAGNAQEVVGKTDHDFFPKRRADAYREDDLAVMRSDQPIINRIESAPEPDGSPRLVMTSKLPLHDEKGGVIGVFGISRQVDRRLTASSQTAKRFARVVAHIHDHFSERITTGELARMAALSESHFERTFRAAFGTSPKRYLIGVRVESSCRMLKETDRTVAEIALECGFHDHAHFCRIFKQQMGLTPSAYRHSSLEGPGRR